MSRILLVGAGYISRVHAEALAGLPGHSIAAVADPDEGAARRLAQAFGGGAVYASADVGTPPVGTARGRVIRLTDTRLPRVKAGLANAVWRGKDLAGDGAFVNRWAGGVRAIASHYVIGPSWADGRPAIVMEYAPGTPLFANTRDELRQVGPGLYLGPLYDRCPCPRLRGYIALEVESCR